MAYCLLDANPLHETIPSYLKLTLATNVSTLWMKYETSFSSQLKICLQHVGPILSGLSVLILFPYMSARNSDLLFDFVIFQTIIYLYFLYK